MIPTSDTLNRAGEILRELEKLQAELLGLFGSAAGTGKRRGRPPGTSGVKRKKMSAEGKARIAAAAKARWAKFRAEKKGGK